MADRGEKLRQPHCYHQFSDSRDTYLTKNHYENYSPKMVPTNPTGSWTMSSQANFSFGFIRRNLRSCPEKLTEVAYISMVRSVMEYSAIIWDPHTRKDIDSLERVQRRAARFFKKDYNPRSSVTRMITNLGWSDLSHRWRDLRLALFYKVVTAIKADMLTGANHPNMFKHIRADSTELLNVFTINTMEDWNRLPASVIASPSLASFNTRLAQQARVDFIL